MGMKDIISLACIIILVAGTFVYETEHGRYVFSAHDYRAAPSLVAHYTHMNAKRIDFTTLNLWLTNLQLYFLGRILLNQLYHAQARLIYWIYLDTHWVDMPDSAEYLNKEIDWTII